MGQSRNPQQGNSALLNCTNSEISLPTIATTQNDANFNELLALFHCKLNRCLTSCGVGIAGKKLRCKAFSALVFGSQVPGAGGFFPID
jgi:hypothetical protein